MREIAVNGTVGLFLLLNACLDWKKREISLMSLVVFGAAGVGIHLCFPCQQWAEVVWGMGIGGIVIILAFFTNEAVGFGDGLLLSVTGVYLGPARNLCLLLSGLILFVLIMGTLLILGRVRKEERLPLVPFLFLAFVGGMIF